MRTRRKYREPQTRRNGRAQWRPARARIVGVAVVVLAVTATTSRPGGVDLFQPPGSYQAPSTQIVDRTLKGDRLLEPSSLRLTPRAKDKTPAGGPDRSFACDTAFSPLQAAPQVNFLSRCLATIDAASHSPA
jgi:hypothetical protein